MSFLYVYATEVLHCFAAPYLVLCLPVSLDSVSSCISVHLAYQILLHNCTILTPEIGLELLIAMGSYPEILGTPYLV